MGGSLLLSFLPWRGELLTDTSGVEQGGDYILPVSNTKLINHMCNKMYGSKLKKHFGRYSAFKSPVICKKNSNKT